ncbi:MAG: RNA polymerase sigma factor [Propionibacterium sp.]|nr:RNA polymerase sigma factor [Propionibacterium sp.]
MPEQGKIHDWRASADEVFRNEYTVLKQRADRIGGSVIDGDDLLSDAVEQLIVQHLRGRGPATHVAAYLTRTMRNRVIDEVRSPRSRVRHFYDDEEFVHADDTNFHVEAAPETRWTREALARLPEAMRTVLVETAVHDRSPGELIKEQRRSPNAVYSQIRRAKHRLRRELLVVMLQEDAPSLCCERAELLPDVIAPHLDDMDPKSEAVQHLSGCCRCVGRWQRFSTIRESLSS